MTAINENFEFLFTTDASYGQPIVVADTIKLCVRELNLMKGHPLHTGTGDGLKRLAACHFIFEDVTSSVRILVPYIGDPKVGSFGEAHTECDGPFGQHTVKQGYGFEGRMENPPAWVRDWVIVAGSFTLLVP